MTVLNLNSYAHNMTLLISEAHARVDERAEASRLKYITPGAGQAITYAQKEAEAVSYVATVTPVDTDYPMIKAQSVATGETMLVIANVIIGTANGWRPIAAQIEALRMKAKEDISSSLSLFEIKAVEASLLLP